MVGFASDLISCTEQSEPDDDGDEERLAEENEILAEISRDADAEEHLRVDHVSNSYLTERGDVSVLSQTASLVIPDDGFTFGERVRKVGREMDVLMRYLMKRVEGHSSGGEHASEHDDQTAAQSFSALSFMLEDWDL